MAHKRAYEQSEAIVGESSSRTSSKITKHVHTWTIDNFSKVDNEMNTLKSSQFQTEDSSKIKWQLEFGKYMNTITEEVCFSMFLYYLPDESHQVEMDTYYSFFIIGLDNNRVFEQIPTNKRTFKPLGSDSNWGFNEFITKTRLFESKDVFLPNDQLTLGCELAFFSTTVTEGAKYVSSKKIKSLSFDLEEALKHRPTDVVIKVGDKEIQAHKFMLSARSVVVAAMFDHDTVEKQTSCIEIEDVEFEVMREFIHFLYTDTCPKLKEFAYDLFILADKYNVESLKMLAEEELANNLTVENVVRILVQADGQNNEQLQEAAIKFIAANFHAIPKDEEWNDLKKNHLNMFEKILFAFADK